MAQEQRELMDAEQDRTQPPAQQQQQTPPRDPNVRRGGPGVHSQHVPPQQRSSPARRGTRKGTAMDALAIFGALSKQ
jgi:hypothetical protein